MTLHVLVISQETANRNLLKAALKKIPITLLVTENSGADTDEKNIQGPFDIILTDSTLSEKQRKKIKDQVITTNWKASKRNPCSVRLRQEIMSDIYKNRIHEILLNEIFEPFFSTYLAITSSPTLFPVHPIIATSNTTPVSHISTPTQLSPSSVTTSFQDSLENSPLSLASTQLSLQQQMPTAEIVGSTTELITIETNEPVKAERFLSTEYRGYTERGTRIPDLLIIDYLSMQNNADNNGEKYEVYTPHQENLQSDTENKTEKKTGSTHPFPTLTPSVSTLFGTPPWEKRREEKRDEEKKKAAAEASNSDNGCCHCLSLFNRR